MTNKLIVIIKVLKVPKIKKILLYEMKFLVPNYSCLQNPWVGGYRPQIPVFPVLCPQLNLLNPLPPEQNSWVSHCSLIILSNLMMRKSEMAETCSWYIKYNCKYNCVMTAVTMDNCFFMFSCYNDECCRGYGKHEVFALQHLDGSLQSHTLNIFFFSKQTWTCMCFRVLN